MDRYDGYTINVHEMTGNLLAGDTTGLDIEESPRRYVRMLREQLQSEFPGARIEIDLERAQGVCPETRVYTPDGDEDDGAIAHIGSIEERLWGSSEWYVETPAEPDVVAADDARMRYSEARTAWENGEFSDWANEHGYPLAIDGQVVANGAAVEDALSDDTWD